MVDNLFIDYPPLPILNMVSPYNAKASNTIIYYTEIYAQRPWPGYCSYPCCLGSSMPCSITASFIILMLLL